MICQTEAKKIVKAVSPTNKHIGKHANIRVAPWIRNSLPSVSKKEEKGGGVDGSTDRFGRDTGAKGVVYLND
jgi:hypothetical protein